MPQNTRKRLNVSVRDITTELDSLNIAIIKELLGNADVKSAMIAEKYHSPLSTVQRRRTRLERTIMKKKYHIDISRLGWRYADLLVSVAKGDCEGLAKKLFQEYGGNIVEASLRIGDPQVNVMARAYYKSTEELHNLVEEIKSIQGVNAVEWSEVVKVVADNNAGVIDRIFDSDSKR